MSHWEEQAVSPVVGVMLMLVVTIIIASVVSAFAGGLWGNTDKAPVVTIQASIDPPRNITLTDVGGDPFLVRDVKLIVSNDTTSLTFTNSSVNYPLNKSVYSEDNSPGLVRAGDKLVGWNSSAFVTGQEYRWSLVHVPSQKTIATGKAYT